MEEDQHYPAAFVESVLDIGRQVKFQREQRGWTQGDVARLANVGRRVVSEIENGKKTVQFDKLVRVCFAVGIELLTRCEIAAPIPVAVAPRLSASPTWNPYDKFYRAAVARFGKNTNELERA